MSTISVSFLIVSHSAKLAAGVVELASQMAPEVEMAGVGGTAEGELGSSFDAIYETLGELLAANPDGEVIVVGDIGSSIMTAETAIDACDDPERVHLVNGPLVEGTIAGAVAAQQGATALIVATAIERAADSFRRAEDSETPAPQPEVEASDTLSEEIVIGVPEGLHARPAALVARTASDLECQLEINGVDATSVLALMGLGARQGDTVTISAQGPAAAQAIAAIRNILVVSEGESES